MVCSSLRCCCSWRSQSLPWLCLGGVWGCPQTPVGFHTSLGSPGPLRGLLSSSLSCPKTASASWMSPSMVHPVEIPIFGHWGAADKAENGRNFTFLDSFFISSAVLKVLLQVKEKYPCSVPRANNSPLSKIFSLHFSGKLIFSYLTLKIKVKK